MREATDVLGVDGDRVELVMHQFVTITSGGERVKQSTRKATFVTVDELVDEVGADVFRFFMIEEIRITAEAVFFLWIAHTGSAASSGWFMPTTPAKMMSTSCHAAASANIWSARSA